MAIKLVHIAALNMGEINLPEGPGGKAVNVDNV